MGNFFTDNDDLRFLFDHLDVERIAGLMEEGYRYAGEYEDAPADAAETKDKYLRILTELGQLAADEIEPTAAETDRVGNTLNPDGSVTYTPGISHALKRLGEIGLMGLTLPYSFGGRNCPNMMLAATNDIISRADASLMNLYGLQGIGETINAYADDEIKKEFLPDLASGRKTAAMVLTEPESGSDLQSVKVTATEQPDGTWRLNGVKRFITNGCGHVLLVMARSEHDIEDGRGLSLFLVERGPGVRVRRIEDKLGIHGSPTCELEFTDAPGRLIGERKLGLIRYVMQLMYGARMGIAAQACGIGDAAYRVARAYAHERRQFGTAIEAFPAVRELLVKSSIDLQAARALTYYGSFCVDLLAGAERVLASDLADDTQKKRAKADARYYKKLNGMLTPMCKYYASEMSMRVAMNSISVMGGNGYMRDYPLERHLRDSRITTIYEGTSQLQIVPAVGSVVNGVARDLLTTLLDRDWPDEIKPLADRVRGGIDDLTAAIEHVKAEPDANYRRLYARALVDMAIDLIVGALFCDQATSSERKRVVAEHWIGTKMPEVHMLRERVCSGEQLVLTEFETLAGEAPEAVQAAV